MRDGYGPKQSGGIGESRKKAWPACCLGVCCAVFFPRLLGLYLEPVTPPPKPWTLLVWCGLHFYDPRPNICRNSSPAAASTAPTKEERDVIFNQAVKEVQEVGNVVVWMRVSVSWLREATNAC